MRAKWYWRIANGWIPFLKLFAGFALVTHLQQVYKLVLFARKAGGRDPFEAINGMLIIEHYVWVSIFHQLKIFLNQKFALLLHVGGKLIVNLIEWPLSLNTKNLPFFSRFHSFEKFQPFLFNPLDLVLVKAKVDLKLGQIINLKFNLVPKSWQVLLGRLFQKLF